MYFSASTQQNAALVEEASAAARSMEQQAEALAGAVSVFRYAGTGEVRGRSSQRRIA